MAFKRFFVFEKINGFQIVNLYKDIFSQYCSTNVLYDFLRQSKNKQEIEERKKIIIDHIQKNSILFHNERGYFSSLYSQLKNCFDFLKQSNEKDWRELEDYLLEFIKKNPQFQYTDIYLKYCNIFKKESKFINSIINELSLDHEVLLYLLNNVSDKNLVDEYLKNKITDPMSAYIYIETTKDIQSEEDLKKIPSFILDLLASDYSTFFNFFIYHLNRKKIRFDRIEKRMLIYLYHFYIFHS